jgi:hypothetical protein
MKTLLILLGFIWTNIAIAQTTTVNGNLTVTGTTNVGTVTGLDIVDADINAAAAISQSKIVDAVDADIDAAANIAQSKLNLSITNAEINAAAAISQSKIVDAVDADIDAAANISQSKLNLSITDSEVNGAAAIAGSKIDPTFTIPVEAADGTVALPGYSFSSDTDTGIFRETEEINFTVNNNEIFEVRKPAADSVDIANAYTSGTLRGEVMNTTSGAASVNGGTNQAIISSAPGASAYIVFCFDSNNNHSALSYITQRDAGGDGLRFHDLASFGSISIPSGFSDFIGCRNDSGGTLQLRFGAIRLR